MAEKVDEDPRQIRHRKKVAKRAIFLGTLTPSQRRMRDNHIAWVRWWRKEYKDLVAAITANKSFIRRHGVNNLATLKLAMRRLQGQRLKARTMLLARMASKVDYAMKVEQPKTQVAA